ncbi:flavin reductase like domain protein [mine drainage metagenome]|uniref:Flavin reductase like domain protein n=1 Tax=mine drainage metagenome TaxID=410659 RepID=A0A1J5QQI0_9ZZZZ
MHIRTEPSILYFGTPVVLIGSLNDDGTHNLAPISSVFWLGWRCMLGIASSSRTAQNLLRSRGCVLNLPSITEVAAVNKLARTTGAYPVPVHKVRKGYDYVADKFEVAGLTAVASETVAAPRVEECPIQLEAIVETAHGIAADDPKQRGQILCLEVRITRVHVEESLLMSDQANRIDPNKWRPLIMSFQEFYGLGPQLHASTLGQIPEYMYRSSDVDRARAERR